MEYSSGGYARAAVRRVQPRGREPGSSCSCSARAGAARRRCSRCSRRCSRRRRARSPSATSRSPSLSGDALTDYRRNTVGVVFQAFNLIPSLTARENVSISLRNAGVGAPRRGRAPTSCSRWSGSRDRMGHKPGDALGRAAATRRDRAGARARPAADRRRRADRVASTTCRSTGSSGCCASSRRPAGSWSIATHDERLLPLADRVVELTPQAVARESRRPNGSSSPPAQVLFRQGDAGRSGLRGRLRRDRDRPRAGRRRRGARSPSSSPGGYFGELAPMFGLRRSATARARRSVPTGRDAATALRDFRSRRERRRHAPGDPEPCPGSVGVGRQRATVSLHHDRTAGHRHRRHRHQGRARRRRDRRSSSPHGNGSRRRSRRRPTRSPASSQRSPKHFDWTGLDRRDVPCGREGRRGRTPRRTSTSRGSARTRRQLFSKARRRAGDGRQRRRRGRARRDGVRRR